MLDPKFPIKSPPPPAAPLPQAAPPAPRRGGRSQAAFRGRKDRWSVRRGARSSWWRFTKKHQGNFTMEKMVTLKNLNQNPTKARPR